MRVCLAIPEVDTGLVLDTATALANYNARTYRCEPGEKCTRDPWSLEYDSRAGDSVIIDGEPTVVMRDAVTLMRVGRGACGELSAAYAGWLIAHKFRPTIIARLTGPDAWHAVVKMENGFIVDPARLETVRPWRDSYGVR